MERHCPITVLVLESSLSVAEATVAALKSKGFLAIWAASRHEAEHILFDRKIDVLIVHGDLSDDDSPCQFAAEAAIAFPDIAIVLTSSDPDAARLALPTRAVVLAKPLGLERLLSSIDDAFATGCEPR
jgi:DNA-binding NtrC family response regulator